MAEQDFQEEVAQILENDKMDKADQIRLLHDMGFSREQLIKELGFASSTVYRVLPACPEKKEKEAAKESWNDGLPVVRKMGGGVEMIAPEAVLRRYMDGESEQQELRGMMKLRAAMLMVMDLVNILKGEAEADARRLEPILKLMKETREEQDAAAQRAKASVTEAATQAAEETASRVATYFSQKKSEAASSPMEGVLARVMETTLTNLMSRLFPGSGVEAPPGFTVEKKQKGV